MVLQANNVAVECKHVVNTFILKRLNIDRFILGQLDEITNHVVLGGEGCVNIVETEIKGVDTHRVFAFLHRDHINLPKRVAGLERHQSVERLCQQDLHLVELAQLLDAVADVRISRQVASVNLVVGADRPFDCIAHMESEREVRSRGSSEAFNHSVDSVEARQISRPANLRNDFNSCDQRLVSHFCLLFHQPLVFLIVDLVLGVGQLPGEQVLVTLRFVGAAVPPAGAFVENANYFVEKFCNVVLKNVRVVYVLVDTADHEYDAYAMPRNHDLKIAISL